MEELIGKISVSWRHSFHPPLDGLVLPRPWLLANNDLSSKKGIWIALTGALLDSVKDLLMYLRSDTARREPLQASPGEIIS